MREASDMDLVFNRNLRVGGGKIHVKLKNNSKGHLG